MAIIDPRAAKLVTGRHWVEDDGAARLEATEKGLGGEAIVKEGRTLTCSDPDPTSLEHRPDPTVLEQGSAAAGGRDFPDLVPTLVRP